MSCEARTRGSGEVPCAKSTFFRCCSKEREKPDRSVGFNHKGEKLFCLLFSDPIIVGLDSFCYIPGTSKYEVFINIIFRGSCFLVRVFVLSYPHMICRMYLDSFAILAFSLG